MRLSDVLSKNPKSDFDQIDGFVTSKKGNIGQKVELDVGTIRLNYFCKKCNDLRTFSSCGKLACIFINKNLISIDSVLSCGCGTTVQIWFLIESSNDITSRVPNVRILKRTEKLSSDVELNKEVYGVYSEWLDKAEIAYRNELGAGAIIYLRKIYEDITIKTATSEGITTTKSNGSKRPFKDVLQEVDAKKSIIPKEFSVNGYKLFGELSNIAHGTNISETDALQKYSLLRRLVVGILDNVKNSAELMAAIGDLGWS